MKKLLMLAVMMMVAESAFASGGFGLGTGNKYADCLVKANQTCGTQAYYSVPTHTQAETEAYYVCKIREDKACWQAKLAGR